MTLSKYWVHFCKIAAIKSTQYLKVPNKSPTVLNLTLLYIKTQTYRYELLVKKIKRKPYSVAFLIFVFFRFFRGRRENRKPVKTRSCSSLSS